MTQGQKFKYVRELSGMSQKELAGKLHMTPQAISRWENDQSEPSMDTIQKMAQLYGVSVSSLYVGSDSNETPQSVNDDDVETVDTAPVSEPERTATNSYFSSANVTSSNYSSPLSNRRYPHYHSYYSTKPTLITGIIAMVLFVVYVIVFFVLKASADQYVFSSQAEASSFSLGFIVISLSCFFPTIVLSIISSVFAVKRGPKAFTIVCVIIAILCVVLFIWTFCVKVHYQQYSYY